MSETKPRRKKIENHKAQHRFIKGLGTMTYVILGLGLCPDVYLHDLEGEVRWGRETLAHQKKR